MKILRMPVLYLIAVEVLFDSKGFDLATYVEGERQAMRLSNCHYGPTFVGLDNTRWVR